MSGDSSSDLTFAVIALSSAGSGNGDHVRRSTAFLAAQTLAQSHEYKDKKLGDGLSVAQHYARWEAFMYDWLKWTATVRLGLLGFLQRSSFKIVV